MSKIEILERIHKIKSKKIASSKEEDYLEVIYELVNSKGFAKPRDISRILNVRAPSVTKMLQRLAEKNLINYERYGGVSLTDEGKRVAKDIIGKHKKIIDFLMFLGIDEKVANLEAEGIEHVISEETLNRIHELYKFINDDQELRKRFSVHLKNYLERR
ncbi:MAG TPA: metal-dependent transcriptional regulator [Geobacterales bacterium]|nr:metal-dependent transcriptional regulator [Geobacterales bacterium]